MLIKLRNTSSLSNLYKASLGGQIPTLLILIMVLILIFIITTVNLGRLSVTATTISNAADTTVLAIASQLATYSRETWVGLNKDNEGAWDVKRCKKGGLFGKILAGIGAIVCMFVPGLQLLGSYLLAAIIGGAIGGFIGEGIVQRSWKGAGYGALMGAGIGFATAGGTALSLIWAGPGIAIGAGVGITTGALIGVGLGAASSIYATASKQAAYEKEAAALMDKIGKINDDYTRMRESAIFQALSMVVDDPERVQDEFDIDSDGDTDEKVSRFLYDYYTEYLPKIRVISRIAAIQAFQGRLKSFINPKNDKGAREFLRWIHRQEVECSVCCDYSECGEGPIVALVRSLKACKDDSGQPKYAALSFWEPLPDQSELLAWYDCDSPTDCNKPQGFDEIDFTHLEYEEFIDTANLIINKDPAELDRNLEWLNPFFKPNDAGEYVDFYDRLSSIANGSKSLKGMPGWQEQLESAVAALPRCQLVYGEFTASDNYKDTEHPCGPPYNPWPEEGEPGSRFYPCVWREPLAEPEIGTYFPNPPCKISFLERAGIIQQLEAIEKAIDNDDAVYPGLKQKLWEKFSSEAQAACETNCAKQGGNCSCSMSDFDLKIDKLSLSNSGKQPSCYKGPANSTPSIIDYSYHYTYNCAGFCEETDAAGNRGSRYINTCSPSPCRGEGTGKVTLAKDVIDDIVDVNVGAGVTDIIDVPEVVTDPEGTLNAKNAEEKFMTMLEEIKTLINNLSIVAPQPGVPGKPFVTLDKDDQDEFEGPSNMLTTQIQEVNRFLRDINLIYQRFREPVGPLGSIAKPKDGRSRPVSYEWEDSVGIHKVTVQTGPFKLASIVKKKYGKIKVLWNKTCWEMENYCENTPGCPRNANYTWVVITREDQADKDEISDKKNVLGKWFGIGKARVRTTRSSAASYSYNKVGLARVTGLSYLP